jgi:hypothetical protein
MQVFIKKYNSNKFRKIGKCMCCAMLLNIDRDIREIYNEYTM